jgi:hypothetical protein
MLLPTDLVGGAANRRDLTVARCLLVSFVLQYNPYFLYEYLWRDYWTGAALRTALSYAFLVPVVTFQLLSERRHSLSVNIYIAGSFATAAYGLFISTLSGQIGRYAIADGIFWVEIGLYIFVFSRIDSSVAIRLIRGAILYGGIAGVGSVILFLLVQDEIAVAAMVGGERIARLADLEAPLLLILCLVPRLSVPFAQKVVVLVPLALVILLGLFRSVWAALLISFTVSLLFSSSQTQLYRGVIGIVSTIVFAFAFQFAYELYTGVPGVVWGRIEAAVGTADSLGRIESVLDVVDQLMERPYAVLFGAGFGALAWFVNDFGFGEVVALQPVGSLSNYFIVLWFQLGLLWYLLVFLPVVFCLSQLLLRCVVTDRSSLVAFFIYLVVQWLSFPTTLHFPIAWTLAAAVVLAAASAAEVACGRYARTNGRVLSAP